MLNCNSELKHEYMYIGMPASWFCLCMCVCWWVDGCGSVIYFHRQKSKTQRQIGDISARIYSHKSALHNDAIKAWFLLRLTVLDFA